MTFIPDDKSHYRQFLIGTWLHANPKRIYRSTSVYHYYVLIIIIYYVFTIVQFWQAYKIIITEQTAYEIYLKVMQILHFIALKAKLDRSHPNEAVICFQWLLIFYIITRESENNEVRLSNFCGCNKKNCVTSL